MIGGGTAAYVISFGIICIAMQVHIKYSCYVSILKWAALVLFAYFGTMLMVHIPLGKVAWGLLVPTGNTSKNFIALIVFCLNFCFLPVAVPRRRYRLACPMTDSTRRTHRCSATLPRSPRA